MGRHAAEKHQAIIDAAVKVFAEHGYHRAQVHKVAEAAGVAGGTVYNYFENKQDLLVSLFHERMGGLIRTLENKLERVNPADGRLACLIEHHFAVLAADRDLAVVTQIELRQPEEEVRQRISEVLRLYFDVIDRVVAGGQEAGAFRPDLDRRVIRNLIFGTMDQTVTAWVLSGFKYDLVGLAEPVCRMFLSGIAREGSAVRPDYRPDISQPNS